MERVDTLDGPLDVIASDRLLREVEEALSFLYAYGRHPYRSLGGFKTFVLTTSDFRFIEDGRYWRLTLDQTQDMLKKIWPDESGAVMARLEQYQE